MDRALMMNLTVRLASGASETLPALRTPTIIPRSAAAETGVQVKVGASAHSVGRLHAFPSNTRH